MSYDVTSYLNAFAGLRAASLSVFEAPSLVPDRTRDPSALDEFSAGGSALGSWSPTILGLQAQLLALMTQQMLLDLLVAYFAAGGQQREQPGDAHSFAGLPQWSREPQSTSWRTPSREDRHEPSARPDEARARSERGVPHGLRANASRGARVARELGFDGTIGGLGQRAGRSDHPHGNAIDVMTNSDTAMGNRVAEHFRNNHAELGVKYVIYRQRIASPRTGWQWRPMEDRGNPTANHMDHPHISFR